MKKPIANEYWLTSTGFQPLHGLWRHQKVLKGTVSSPVYPKTVSAVAASSELEGKRELYRVRVVNQLAVLLRMRILSLLTR